jgi:hypothetical protein
MTQPIHLIGDTYAMEKPEGATGFFFDGRMSIGFYYEGELRFTHLPGHGNWQIICTTKGVKAMHAPELFGHAMISDHYAQETIIILLASKDLNPETNYLIIKKVS